jgi:hypothetical protein
VEGTWHPDPGGSDRDRLVAKNAPSNSGGAAYVRPTQTKNMKAFADEI